MFNLSRKSHVVVPSKNVFWNTCVVISVLLTTLQMLAPIYWVSAKTPMYLVHLTFALFVLNVVAMVGFICLANEHRPLDADERSRMLVFCRLHPEVFAQVARARRENLPLLVRDLHAAQRYNVHIARNFEKREKEEARSRARQSGTPFEFWQTMHQYQEIDRFVLTQPDSNPGRRKEDQ